MGILILISGSNNSGKSLFAEQLIAQTSGERYYIATMHPCTEDNYRRIEKHRRQRAGLGFQTLECPYQIQNAPISGKSVVLLEDVSNLLANVLFEKKGDADSVFLDICSLLNRCRVLVAVTISGLHADGYDEKTSDYINRLNTMNQKLFDRAAVAVTMEEQIPRYQKGEAYDLSRIVSGGAVHL